MDAGRLAPSPTGAQHLGNARTYLLAYWSARSSNKRIVLRIEDIDSPRVKPWAAQQAIDDLRWLGIDWDEGPYTQTNRRNHYTAALNELIRRNLVFPCTCTRQDIGDAASAPHFEHEGNLYPGTCSSWQLGDAIPEEGTYCWRFRLSDLEDTFTDIVAGVQSCNPAKHLGAFPVTQKSGDISYQLACVVDDEAMGITEVVRGDDLLPSAFRQRELAAALEYRKLSYAHVPLVRGVDGRRLAKRHGDTRLSHYRDSGIRPEQIVGWAAASAGITETAAPTTADKVIALFDWKKLNRLSVVVSEHQSF